MKKYIMTIIFALGLMMSMSAQNDSFFKTNYGEYREDNEWGELPLLPESHGNSYDYVAAPLGSGLLLLAGLGMGYAAMRKRK